MDSQWLKTLFATHPSHSKADLAKALGLEPSAVSKILAGTRQIKAQEYIVMRQYFGLPTDGMSAARQDGQASSYTISPLSEPAGFTEDIKGAEGEWIIPANIIAQRTQAPPGKIKIFQVNENAMQPDFNYGESVLVDVTDMVPSPPGVFIVSDGYGHMIRRCAFIPGKKPPGIAVSANSDSFRAQILKQDDFKIIGRVIAKLQML